jgi:hypothetical protein
MVVSMGLSKYAQTALIGIGIGSGAVALVVLFCWLAFIRLCNASRSSEKPSVSSLSGVKLPSKQLNTLDTTLMPPLPHSSTENSIDMDRPPPPPPSTPPPPPPHMTARILEDRVPVRAAASRQRKQRQSDVLISRNENRPIKTTKWRTLASFVTHFRVRKKEAQTKSNPPANEAAHDPSSRKSNHADPFELYDAEYGAVFLRNVVTDEASRLAGWKQKALQTILDVENASVDDDNNDGTTSSVVVNSCSPSFNKKNDGAQTTREALHDSSTVLAGFLGGSPSPWTWLTCYSSPPLQVDTEL